MTRFPGVASRAGSFEIVLINTGGAVVCRHDGVLGVTVMAPGPVFRAGSLPMAVLLIMALAAVNLLNGLKIQMFFISGLDMTVLTLQLLPMHRIPEDLPGDEEPTLASGPIVTLETILVLIGQSNRDINQKNENPYQQNQRDKQGQRQRRGEWGRRG